MENGDTIVSLTRDSIPAEELGRFLVHPDCGGIVSFIGTARAVSRGKRVVSLELEAYEPMAESALLRLVEEARENWGPLRCAFVHRLGVVAPGELLVWIGVATAHRAEAFEACRFLIESLKKSVPVWKKERYDDGEAWVEGEFPDLQG